MALQIIMRKTKYEGRDEVHTYSFNHYKKCLLHYFGVRQTRFRTDVEFTSRRDVKVCLGATGTNAGSWRVNFKGEVILYLTVFIGGSKREATST